MTKKPKSQPRYAEHIRYGRGEILEVRRLDSGGGIFVADVRFEDGAERTIRLSPEYWKSGIAVLARKPKPDAEKTT